MKDLLRRLKLLDSMTTTLPITKEEFVVRLKEITDEGSVSLFADSFDVLALSKNEFKGTVNQEGFNIERKVRMFDVNMNMAYAKGSFAESNDELVIETEISGFHYFFIVFYAFATVFYCIIFSLIIGDANGFEFIAIPFLLLQATLTFAAPYFTMRRSVQRLKYELERDFYYLTKSR